MEMQGCIVSAATHLKYIINTKLYELHGSGLFFVQWREPSRLLILRWALTFHILKLGLQLLVWWRCLTSFNAVEIVNEMHCVWWLNQPGWSWLTQKPSWYFQEENKRTFKSKRLSDLEESSETYGLHVFVASTSFFTCLELAADTEMPPLFKLTSEM